MKKLDILEKALDKAMKKNYKSPFDFIYEKGKLIEGKKLAHVLKRIQ